MLRSLVRDNSNYIILRYKIN